MGRSFSVWVLLASTGLVMAQAPPAGSTGSNGAPPGSITFGMGDAYGASLVLHEANKTANKCKVLKSWLMPDGSRAYQAQSLISGEMLTIIESGPTEAVSPTSEIEARATQVYHWNGRQVPPPGAPLPPDGVLAPPLLAPAPEHPPANNTASQANNSTSADDGPMTVQTKVIKGAGGFVTEILTSGGGKPRTDRSASGDHQTTPDTQNTTPAGSPALPPGFRPPDTSGYYPGAVAMPAAGGPQYVLVPALAVPAYRNPPQMPMGMPANDGNVSAPPAPQVRPAPLSNNFGPVSSGMPAPLPPNLLPPQYVIMPPPPASYPQQPTPLPNPAPDGYPATPTPAPATQPSPMPPRLIDPVLQRAANANAPQAMSTLRTALLPSERELAIGQLALVDWRTNTVVVQVLVSAACDDLAPAVRAAAVRALAQMNVNTMPVYTALQKLRTDGDPRVLQEVEQALAVLAPGLNASQQEVRQAK